MEKFIFLMCKYNDLYVVMSFVNKIFKRQLRDNLTCLKIEVAGSSTDDLKGHIVQKKEMGFPSLFLIF
jgi:hypothetical protein